MEEDPDLVLVENSTKASSSANPTGEEYISDTELDELLDESLSEFGKHVPVASHLGPPTPQSPVLGTQQPTTTTTVPPLPQPPSLDSAGMEGLFSSEFPAEAESQLNEAMKMLSEENPELWQQFETIAKSMGLDDVGAGPVPPPPFGTASKGESSVDGGSVGVTGEGETAQKTEGSGESSSLDQKLDDTIKRMQENAARVGPDTNHLEGLGDMMSQLDLGSDEGEDHFMKMMQGMMSTLLSKEVLYPSLVDLCKQYPDWLSSHHGKISEEDYQRYTKQFEVMTSICREFDNPAEEEGSPSSQASSEKILHLMQQLQQYGQPPEDMAGENMLEAGIPHGLLGSTADSKNCTVM